MTVTWFFKTIEFQKHNFVIHTMYQWDTRRYVLVPPLPPSQMASLHSHVAPAFALEFPLRFHLPMPSSAFMRAALRDC